MIRLSENESLWPTHRANKVSHLVVCLGCRDGSGQSGLGVGVAGKLGSIEGHALSLASSVSSLHQTGVVNYIWTGKQGLGGTLSYTSQALL